MSAKFFLGNCPKMLRTGNTLPRHNGTNMRGSFWGYVVTTKIYDELAICLMPTSFRKCY